MEPDPRPMEETADEIFDGVSNVILNSAKMVNTIRRQAARNISRAEELEELADQFRHIASLQHEMACRVAQLGAEAISADVLGDDDEDEYDEDFEDEEEDEEIEDE